MPDITMCCGGDCPYTSTCFRYTATANPYWQSFFETPPFNGQGCEYHWDNGRQGGYRPRKTVVTANDRE